jgi:predicted transcriptional regulator
MKQAKQPYHKAMLYLDMAQYEQLRAIAYQTHRSQSDLVREALDSWLEKQKKVEKK